MIIGVAMYQNCEDSMKELRAKFSTKEFIEIFLKKTPESTPQNRIIYLENPYDKSHNCKIRYPRKHERLQDMLGNGLNVADFICFEPNQLEEKKIEKFFEKHRKVSIRHFHEDEVRFPKCPVLYDADNLKKVIEFAKENNKRFYTLINQSISVRDSLFCGTIFWIDDGLRDRKFIMEYFNGIGTPRDIEKKNQSQLIHQYGPIFLTIQTQDPKYEQLKVIVNETWRATALRPIIFEFSYYPYPVGKLQKRQIYWEWRLGDLNYYGPAGNVLKPLVSPSKENKSGGQ